LYDGQTGELLAYTLIAKGKKLGRVFDRQQQRATSTSVFDDANSYIDTRMADDRK
jgi:hypothetical protein